MQLDLMFLLDIYLNFYDTANPLPYHKYLESLSEICKTLSCESNNIT